MPVPTIQIEQADALAIEADVLVLKYAQALYGVDRAAVQTFGIGAERLPRPGESEWMHRGVNDRPSNLLFLGTRPIGLFDYSDVRDFGRRAVVSAKQLPQRHAHVALTVHGPGFGLDEAECFRALLAGIFEGAPASQGIRLVSIVEADTRRADHFRAILDEVLLDLETPRNTHSSADQTTALDLVGVRSREKPQAFVAMPFAPDFDDLFHYGIQGAVNTAGYLCERADLAAFTGDVITWVKERIERADLVIAELTGANPNVYLEVGYAWGRRVPTVLLVRDTVDLKFNVRGQRCLTYKNIRHLEEALRGELASLQNGSRR